MVEPEPTPKNPRKAHIQMDEELAQRLFKEEQAQFEREQRIARERAAEQEAKDAALIEQMEVVQARMDANELLALRLQEQEREQFSIDEQARFLVETIAARKKADRSSKNYIILSEMLDDFDRQDVMDLHRLGLRTEDPLRHVKNHLSIVDNIQVDGAIRDTSRLRFFHFSLKGKAAEWLDIIPPTQATTWDHLVSRFLDHFFPVGRSHEADDCEQSNPSEQVCLSGGDIYTDPSLLRFYQNNDTSPWGNNKRKEKGKDGPEWIVRSKFEDEPANFMLEKKSHTKGIGDILVQHRMGLREQYSQFLSTINKSETLEPEAPMISTDILKITRKPSKTGKHGHENQKSTKRSQGFKAAVKRKVKLPVKFSQKSQIIIFYPQVS
ncbi:DNA-directed DNA polymerase [Tanacetum coccineum]